jgi:hypothetical protein
VRIFVSYAREQREIADRIALGLRNEGHDVYFDFDALSPGEDFDGKIREELTSSQLFLFLISPDSLAPGGYALTELGLARQRWPRPRGRVLPVMVGDTPFDDIDPYLRSVTVLQPVGDVVAEVLARVDAIARRRRLRVAVAAGSVVAVLGLAVAALWIARDRMLGSDALIRGLVEDSATGISLPGAVVEARRAGTLLGATQSDGEGRFSLAFRARRKAGAVELTARHDDYDPWSQSLDLSAVSSEPVERNVGLLASGLRDCRMNAGSGVVVGHILPPVDSPATAGSGFAERIAQMLDGDLLPVVQALAFPDNAVLPEVIACDEASPRSVNLGGRYAQALGADAFLSGNIERTSTGFDVHTLVSDRFALLVPPVRAFKRDVELGDLGAAELDDETLGAILTAIARGYEERRRYTECVEVAVEAERKLGRPTDPLRATRERCQRALGLLDLRRES